MRGLMGFVLCVCVVGVCGAVEKSPIDRPVEIRRVEFNPHSEHKGAKGYLTQTNGIYSLHYDFTGGGHAVAMVVTPREPIWAKRVSFEANHGVGHSMAVVATDSTGQSFFKFARNDPEDVWHRYACEMHSGWVIHWGGPNDGVVRPPFVHYEVNLSRDRKGVPGTNEVGVTQVRNLTWMEVPEDERRAPTVSTNSVAYVMSDFTRGADRFSAGPRLFFRRGQDYRTSGTAIEAGWVTNDFGKVGHLPICNEIPVWGRPVAFRLTVEAPAEAAGLSFGLGGSFYGHGSVPFGQLRKPRPGETMIRQTFEAGAPGVGPWRTYGERKLSMNHRSKRIKEVAVSRGSAPAKTFAVRFVKLEAVVAPGKDLPPLLATPPKGDVPPRELEVGYLNLDGCANDAVSVRVTLKDWQGRILGTSKAMFPATASGARSFVKVQLPSVERLDYVQYICEACCKGERDLRVPAWEASWTRPWTGEGTREKHPEVPWGFGVYIHRSEDRYAFASGYETPTNAAALVRMEERAALARKAGMKWERVELKPAQIEPEKGVYDFNSIDRVLEAADRNGISYYILGSHYWPRGYKPYTKEAYDEWAKVMGMAVARYKDRCRHWEIWNEPNIHFWNGPKEDYVYLCNAAYREIKKADPEAVVVGCSTAGVDLPFIDKCLSWGMTCDAISIHPYRDEPLEEAFLADLAATTNRAKGAKTYLTELGWPTGCDNRTYTERTQAGYFVRNYLTAAGSGTCIAINGYNFVDDGFNVLERENNFGILRRDLTPKPAYRALAVTCNFFDRGTPALEKRVLGKSLDAWVFRMGGKSAVWTTRPARLRVRTNQATRAFDPMDQTISSGSTEHVVPTGPVSTVLFDGDIVDQVLLPGETTSGITEIVF